MYILKAKKNYIINNALKMSCISIKQMIRRRDITSMLGFSIFIGSLYF